MLFYHMGPLSLTRIIFIPAWISNYIHHDGATIEVWEWVSNFIPHFTGYVITYPCDQSYTMLVKGTLLGHLQTRGAPRHIKSLAILLQQRAQAHNKGTPKLDITGHMWMKHYTDVTMSPMASQITSLGIVYSSVYSGADKKNIKAPRHWPLCGEFTGDRWIPRTKDQ